MEITQEELLLLLAHHQGDRIFKQKLDSIQRDDELITALARYIEFNAPFVAGVANLAGLIAARRDLFADINGRDQSVTVASYVFTAVIDEFGDRTLPSRPTHRALALKLLEEVADILGYGPSRLEELARPTNHTQRANKAVLKGYGVNRPEDELDLSQAIGFHIGSELLATREFSMLDEFLRQRYADLVAHLEKNRAYFWIQRHSKVEAEHFAAALLAANLALKYYKGQEKKTRIKERILEGFDSFASVQETFMQDLQ